jgi:glycosyltransferase involved in cell wall biosynthesis
LAGDTAPISVVIPAYNAESFIGDAIRSVQAQTLKPIEIIVIADDCSDRTPQIAAELGATVLEQKRRNMAAGLNLGVSVSTQPWIAFHDADDLWEKDKIALQWEAVESCPTVGIVSCDLCMLYEGKVMPFSERLLLERWNTIKSVAVSEHCHFLEDVKGDFLAHFNTQTTTVMLRRDVFSSIGNFDESLIYCQTRELFARVMARYPLAFVERPLVYVRVHSANHTRNVHGGWASYLSIIDRMLKNPDMYPEGAGRALRELLKRDFHQTERALMGWRADVNSVDSSGVTEQLQPNNPNQP